MKQIAKAKKVKIEKLEKDKERLEGFLADYNSSLREKEQLSEKYAALKKELEKQKGAQERMRKTFHQDMQ